MNDSLAVSLLMSTITLSSPLILAALGGYVSERSGVINIALEGKMLISACVTAIVGVAAHSAVAGLSAGLASSVLLSWLHWLLTQTYRMDHIVSGMAINALAFGATNYLDKRFADPNRPIPPPFLALEMFYVFAFALPIILAIYVRRTRGGLRLQAVGSDSEKARIMGVSPLRVRFGALFATGVFTGLSGALIVTNAKWFTDGMTAGRGFIALAALILGSWKPIPAATACIVFGFFDALQYQVQGTPVFGIRFPAELWSSLPYLVTLIAIAGFLGRSRAPAGLGKL